MNKDWKSLAQRAFEKFLRDQKKSEYTKNGKESTVFDYSKRVMRICKDEGFENLDELAKHISEIVPKYKKGGEKEVFGIGEHSSNGSNLKALEFFVEFVLTL